MTKINKDLLTPLMRQYQEIKREYSDYIVFFRLGDFYELFGEDAIKCAPVLNVVLTKRQGVPMCGVPYHAVNVYISRLLKGSFKVAICEQVEDASKAKGLVKREVVRLITPGTLLEDNLLEVRCNNYLLSLFLENMKTGYKVGIAYVDISTGEFYCTEFDDDFKLSRFYSEVSRIKPNEFLLSESLRDLKVNTNGKLISYVDDYYYTYQYASDGILSGFNITSLKSFGLDEVPCAVRSCGGILYYIQNTQKAFPDIITSIKFYPIDEFMLLDESAIKSLELVEGIFTGTKENSLLEVIDRTITPSGGRLLRKFLLKPLRDIKTINERLDAVEFFVNEGILRRKIRELMKSVCDIERILSRASLKLITPRELLNLKDSLKIVPKLNFEISESVKKYTFIPAIIQTVLNRLSPLNEVIELIEKAISEDAPADIHRGNVIKRGFNDELDELRKIALDGKTYLASLERKERERTGIQSLKIGYTSVFGYYIEVTKPNLHLVPQDYIRKQTLVNAERFITEELKEYEQKILSAEEKITTIEVELFRNIVNEVLKYSQVMKEQALAISELDVFTSLADVAVEHNYTRPVLNNNSKIYIREGRHPVVELKLRKGKFVPNDTYIDGEQTQVIILTGPNMAGKSTYLRQVALIVVLAQMGSFVPAKEAEIGVVDRIFTRIGAADSLATGASTFMVEMQEVANIINNSTERSLLILDEVGRGTSTYDGISIAWAVVENLVNRKKDGYGPKVLFATHYFELTDLANKFSEVKNMSMLVKEYRGEVVFLYKVVDGSSDKSYGIHVAKLAGLPDDLISRAKDILKNLQRKSQIYDIKSSDIKQMEFEFTPEIIEELSNIDINSITPLEALNILSELKRKYGRNE